MICCCECPKDLGCIDPCYKLDTGLTALKNGKHTLVYKFNGAVRKLESETLNIGDEVLFDIMEIVPGYKYQAIIKDPDGEEMVIAIDNPETTGIDESLINYDCITFKPQLTTI